MLQYDDKNCRSLFGSLVFIQDDKIVKTWADDALAILTMRFRDFVRPERLDCDVKGGMIYWTDSDPLSLNTAVSKKKEILMMMFIMLTRPCYQDLPEPHFYNFISDNWGLQG